MQARGEVPVTVKCRIGIDDQDSEADFQRFVERVADAGVRTVHRACAQGLAERACRRRRTARCRRSTMRASTA